MTKKKESEVTYSVSFEYEKNAGNFSDAWADAVSATVTEHDAVEFDEQFGTAREAVETMMRFVGTSDAKLVIGVSGQATKKHKGEETLIVTMRTVN